MDVIHIVHLLADYIALIRIKPILLLHLADIICFKRISMDTTRSLKLGTKANCRCQFDNRRFVCNINTSLDGSLNRLEVVVAIFNDLDMPSICLKPLLDVFCKSTLDISICAIATLAPRVLLQLKITDFCQH